MEDLVYFVIGKENPGGQRPDPFDLEGNPDRDRQKLIREQDVLKEVSVANLSLLCLTSRPSLIGGVLRMYL